MSILIYNATKGLDSADAVFRSRGIAGRTVAPSRAGIHLYNSYRTLLFPDYARNLPFYIASTINNTSASRLHEGNSSANIDMSKIDDLPLPLPDTVIAFGKNTISNEDLSECRLRLLYNRGAEKIYVLEKPSMYTLRVASKLPGASSNIQQGGYPSLNGTRALLLVRKLFHIVAKLSFYKAKEEKVEGALVASTAFTEDVSWSDEYQRTPRTVEESATALKQAQEKASEENAEMDTSTNAAPLLTLELDLPSFPSLKVHNGCVSSIAETEGPGFLFPYFKGMGGQDVDLIMEVVAKYLYLGLGSDDEERLATMINLRADLDKSSASEAGRVVSHIAFGIRASLEHEAVIRILVESGMYKGFVLLSPAILATAHGRIFRPLSGPDLCAAVGELRVHDTALMKIASLLSAIPLYSGHPGAPHGSIAEIDPSSIHSARGLQRHFVKRAENVDQDTQAELNLLANDIHFEEEKDFWKVDSEAIDVLAECLVKETQPDDTAPMYIYRGNFCVVDPIQSVLSAFGATAPSIWFASGRKIRFGNDMKTDPAMKSTEVLVGVKDGQPIKEMQPNVPEFYVRRTTLREATDDWKRVVTEGYVLNPKKLPRKQTLGMKVYSGDELRVVWKSLQRFYRPEKEAPVGVKRVREDAGEVVDTTRKSAKYDF